MKESIVVVTGPEQFCRTPCLFPFPMQESLGLYEVAYGLHCNYVQDISGSQNNMGANFSVHLPIGVSLETVRDRAKVTINH